MQHWLISDQLHSFSPITYGFFQIMKKMCPGRTKNFERYNRIAMGHVQTVQYIATITV